MSSNKAQSKITYAKIGQDKVSIPGFGAMGLSAFYNSKPDRDPKEILKHAYDLGCTFWDTADIYSRTGHGENERLIAETIKHYNIPRKDLFIATKFGFSYDENKKLKMNGSAEYSKIAIERSLKNLGLDYVDLYYVHRVDPNTPVEETVKALDDLRKQGKVRYIGLSECSAEQLKRAVKVAKIDAVQSEYSLFELGVEENGIKQLCKELGIALVAYSPLGHGFLTGSIKSRKDIPADDFRLTLPRFSEENFNINLELVKALEAIAKKKGVTASQLALAWLIKQDALPIPGTTKFQRLEDNFKSTNIELSDDELKSIRDIVAKIKVVGERYVKEGMKYINQK